MDIIEIIPNRIYSIKYDDEDAAEYNRLFNDVYQELYQEHW